MNRFTKRSQLRSGSLRGEHRRKFAGLAGLQRDAVELSPTSETTPTMPAGIWVSQRSFAGLSARQFRRDMLNMQMLLDLAA